MSGTGRGGEPPRTGSSRLPRRQRIGLAVIIAAILVAVTDVWILQHFGANAATKQYPDTYLNAIACPNATQCWAVGQVASAPGGNTLSESRGPLLKLETAGRWRTVAARDLPARKGALEAIACPGASDCWAVGGRPGGGSAIIEHWTGGAWRLAPSPALPGGQLNDIGCASASACWAIGGTQARTGATGDVLEQWNGSVWSIAATLPGGLLPEQLSCPAAGRCLALGLRHGATAAASYSAGRWKAVPAPVFVVGFFGSGSSGNTGLGVRYGQPLFGCASPTMCLAAFPGPKPITGAWNGRTWTAVATSLPAYPVGLTCSGGSGCWLLGMTGTSRPVALRWQGSGWAPVTVRTPRHHHGYLNALACGNRCWAVGGTGGTRANGAPYTSPLIEPLS
jgi:hypothetical protein